MVTSMSFVQKPTTNRSASERLYDRGAGCHGTSGTCRQRMRNERVRAPGGSGGFLGR